MTKKTEPELGKLTAWGRMRKRYVEWKLDAIIESWYPEVFGAFVLLAVWLMGVDEKTYDKLMKQLLPVAISVAAIFAGFQGTVYSIMLSLYDRRVIKKLRDWGVYEKLVDYITWANRYLISFISISFLVLYVNIISSSDWRNLILAVLSSVAITSFIASCRVMSLITKILKKESKA